MKFEMELHPNFVSDIVVKQLQEMYEHTKEAYFGSDPVEARAAIAVVLDYFMAPSDYEQWRADNGFDRNLVDECVEGFDAIATATGTPTFDERYSPEELQPVPSYIERLIDEKLKGKTTKREWVGLTQEELQDLCVKSYHTDNAGETHFNRGYFADAIEAKLKEKNSQ